MLLGTGRYQVGRGGCSPHRMLLGTGRYPVGSGVDAFRTGYYQETLRAAECVTPAVFAGPCTCEKCSSCHAGHVRRRKPKRRKLSIYVPVVPITKAHRKGLRLRRTQQPWLRLAGRLRSRCRSRVCPLRTGGCDRASVLLGHILTGSILGLVVQGILWALLLGQSLGSGWGSVLRTPRLYMAYNGYMLGP